MPQVLADSLRLDFWDVDGGYHTAAQLAQVFARCLRACPKDELALLNPIDTLLSLAGMIEQVITSEDGEQEAATRSHLLLDFRAVLESLANVISLHPKYQGQAVLGNPLFIHLLMESDPDLIAITLSFFGEQADESSLLNTNPEALREIADELLLKIVVGRHAGVAGIAVKVLVRMITHCPEIGDSVAEHDNLERAVSVWKNQPFWGWIEELLSQRAQWLEDVRPEPTSTEQRVMAASRLQALVRGHQTRQRVQKAVGFD